MLLYDLDLDKQSQRRTHYSPKIVAALEKDEQKKIKFTRKKNKPS